MKNKDLSVKMGFKPDTEYHISKCLTCDLKYQEGFKFMYFPDRNVLVCFCQECHKNELIDKPGSERTTN